MSIQRYGCPCCGYLTLSAEPPGTYELCAVCWWEDDLAQFEDPGLTGGANEVSLTQARQNFETFGASADRYRGLARAPHPSEIPPPSLGSSDPSDEAP